MNINRTTTDNQILNFEDILHLGIVPLVFLEKSSAGEQYIETGFLTAFVHTVKMSLYVLAEHFLAFIFGKKRFSDL